MVRLLMSTISLSLGGAKKVFFLWLSITCTYTHLKPPNAELMTTRITPKVSLPDPEVDDVSPPPWPFTGLSPISTTPMNIVNTITKSLHDGTSTLNKHPKNKTNAMVDDFTIVYTVNGTYLNDIFPNPMSPAVAIAIGMIYLR